MSDSTERPRISVGNIVRTIEQDGVPVRVRGTVIRSSPGDKGLQMADVLWPLGEIKEYFWSDLIVEAQNIQTLVMQQHATRDKDLRELSLEALRWAKENGSVSEIREVFAKQGIGIPTDRYLARIAIEFDFEGTLQRDFTDDSVDEEQLQSDVWANSGATQHEGLQKAVLDWDGTKWRDVKLDEFQTTCRTVFMIDEEGEPVL